MIGWASVRKCPPKASQLRVASIVCALTLIVPFMSHDYVALASDRRITWQIGGASSRWEDTENKAVVLAGHFLMGYTGFARLGQVKTEQWVVEKLGGVDPTSYFSVLAAETEDAVKALRQPLERSGHAFAAVGYAAVREEGSGELNPFGVTVSNALGDGEYGTWAPAAEFVARRIPPVLRQDDFRLNAFGMCPPRHVLDETVDLIRRYRKRHPGRVLGVLQLMVDLVRRTADRWESVSKDVSVSVLPRSAVPATEVSMPVSGGLLLDPIETLTCMFVRDGNAVEQANVYGPATVAPGFMTFGAEIWTTKPPWWKD
jgi:hypothetical protein